jgi:DNA-binding transcriptional ArsR family regulator
MDMGAANTLRPTLWRTCRVLANRIRLRMFARLLLHPNQTVTTVASQLNLPLPLTSSYLRAMEARGLLAARRLGRRVYYRVPVRATVAGGQPIVTELRRTFHGRPAGAAETVYRLATAFTHPRRIEVYRALDQGPQTVRQLQTLTGISRQALMRHLAKLERRGFVVHHSGGFSPAIPRSCLGAVLAATARESERPRPAHTFESVAHRRSPIPRGAPVAPAGTGILRRTRSRPGL